MRILVNNEEIDVDDKTTVEDLVERLGYPLKGIAVAVDWTVLPRTDWHTELSDGARVEVVTAVQGG
ncbi:sulfur carrier protein ThiS [Mycolicibacterium confluentis]|uniref:Thiamine biosynthesis protein ThiS n=1 Tax=Mycolicibacterium confluentis TaxID=28047 RepID=A0A7I7Y1R0_9MYCO|nr:sulfur carrier protein ThiS [Mycolicibacterium confluentis]MCV7320489.1 sulfur carrier protein ThiS [Mycolicibacterium confluentis]ORV30154.1 thiamine biosynthesis protein ThiS [Mycolicibacterium confluentis]BBZ35527.1 thiamine biosynthesis protein ThiS [Mycolicibacterium confluentis]